MMKRVSIFFVLLSLFLPLPSFAFNYNYIISDKELEDYSSMSLQDIKFFLSDHNSFLRYVDDFYPEDGTFMSTAEIIWRTSQKFQINPKFLMTLLEKEQSLISLAKPAMKRLDWAMGYAVCDKCSLSHPKIIQFKGFAKQVYGAAEKIRNDYFTDLETSGQIKNGFGVGITRKVDRKYKITPVNKATAILYTYTPHVAGNKSFYVLWKNWFSELKYPDGSLLQDIKSGGAYLIESGKKRPFLTESAFTSRYNKNQLVEATPSFLSRYETGEPIKFDNFSLLRGENGVVYLLDDETLRPFDSLKAVRALELNPADIINAAAPELAGYALGEPITVASDYPAGNLVQLKSGAVYWLYSGIKYPISDKSILKTLFPKKKPEIVDESLLSTYPDGGPLKFKGGTLIRGKTNSAVYFVSDGKLRPIPSEEIFLAYNWRWENVINTTDKIINSYELGAPISLEGDSNSPAEESADEATGLIPSDSDAPAPAPIST